MRKCSAYPASKDVNFCSNGFPTKPACRGLHGTPICMNEELSARLYGDIGGAPTKELIADFKNRGLIE
jgi:hypothetical protein